MTKDRPPAVPRDVYLYFDNDAKIKAPFDAERLARRVGLPPLHKPGAPLEEVMGKHCGENKKLDGQNDRIEFAGSNR